MKKLEKPFQTMGQLLPATLARLERTYGAAPQAAPTPPHCSPPSTPKKRKKPLKTEWQRKWLDLEVVRPQVQTAADAVQKWAAKFSKNDKEIRLLVIVGDYGVGKTEIAERLKTWARAVRTTIWGMGWPAPPRVEFVEFGKVAFLETDEFKNWLDGHNQPGAETDLMFVEDIGAEVDKFSKGEPTERLRQILNDMKNRFVVVTTNVPVAEWEKRWDGRIMDRLFRNSKIIQMTGVPSYQKTKREP